MSFFPLSDEDQVHYSGPQAMDVPKTKPANLFRFTMNRFLNRKKTDEAPSTNNDASTQFSTPPVSPGLKKSSTSRWKKTKKQPEPKQEISIEGVLPSSDDFRTSLLMPNLSQRFSMLREQDDPSSLMGKASDDSVLQPRRPSRMLDFGYGSNGLGDIAEVQSINSSIRPPFATNRQDSYGSEEGYGSETDGASVMSRARPGEGNVLFGGRQKVYMIPKSGANSSKSLGRAVYEDDIGKSAFQKHRQREREMQDARGMEMPEDPQSFDFGLGQTDDGDEGERPVQNVDDSARDLSHSPSLSSYEKKRSTTSSTARSEARSSTAATSVASQSATITPSQAPAAPPAAPPPAVPGLERSNTKARRLYEQSLDQNMHEQQASNLTRLNSIQRQRGFNGKPSQPFLHGAKSAGNLNERPPPSVYAYQGQRSPPVAPLTNLGSFKSKGGSPIGSGPVSPLVSPALSDFEEPSALTQALQPGDRGKATAMGAFNKPKQAFDENQYMERQRQLQRSASTAGATRQPGATSAFQQRMGRFEQERERSASNPAARSRSSSATRQLPETTTNNKAFNVFQDAASRNQAVAGAPSEKPDYPDTHRTFFGNISASDSEDDGDDAYRHESQYPQQDQGHGYGRWQPTVLPSVSEHPALRSDASRPALLEEDEEEDVLPQGVPTIHTEGPSVARGITPPPAMAQADLDSPTLGPSAEGLGHMMHHLRQKSNASSLYPQEDVSQAYGEAYTMPALPQEHNFDAVHPSMRSGYDTESRIESTYTNSNSNPWDLDEADGTSYYYGEGNISRSSASPIDGVHPRNTITSSRAPSRATAQIDRHSEVSRYSVAAPNWQAELTKQHARNTSTATQQERAAFDNELAARRAAIQDNIKSMVETDDMRNVSPAPSAGGALKAFMLRSKSSRDSIDTRKEAPTKAMKMLGIGAASSPASTTNLNSQYERTGMSLDGNRPRGHSASRPQMPGRTLQQSDQDAKRERAQSRARGDSDTSRFERPTGRSPTTSSETSRGRVRSNSEATTGRSHSRTGPYRDDLEKAMVEGTGSSAYGVPELSPMVSRELTPRPSPDGTQSQFDSDNRTRSNSRVGVMTNYFDGKTMQAMPNNRNGAGASSPALSPNMYNPAVGSTHASPSMRPFNHAATPPISGNNTPVGASFSPPPMPAGPKVPLRKKTVSKSEISEPVALLSASSNVDTVDLPPGASLKNGMDSPPPVPPINPKRRGARRMFGIGRSESTENTTDVGRSRTPDPWVSRSPDHDMTRSNTIAPAARQRNFSNAQQRAYDSSPNIHQYGFEQSATKQYYGSENTPPIHPYGYEQHALSSPERVDRMQPPPQEMEGGFI